MHATPSHEDRLRARLRQGHASARELTAALGVSQPTLSRTIRGLGPELLVTGRARTTRYALRRSLEGVGGSAPVFEVGRLGERLRHVADLVLVHPGAFRVEGHVDDVPSGWYDDLPWFLQDLRPSGYLGRAIARSHADLGLPSDVRLWSSDHALRWLARFGTDGVGAFVVGREALDRWLASADAAPAAVPPADRATAWPELADRALRTGDPGSSAGGEEPKFLAVRATATDGPPSTSSVPVLVKFSPPLDTAVGRRRGDLLVCEHLALATLADHGRMAARSDLLLAADRVFLEVERFDRQGPRHRIGQVSLGALDAEFVGSVGTWTASSSALLALGLLTPADHEEVRWREAFGHLVGNTDMHLANASVRLRGARTDGIAPAYDVLPMLYAPVANEVIPRVFRPSVPSSDHADLAEAAWAAALDFWGRVAGDERVSPAFRAIARADREAVEALGPAIGALLRRR